MAEVRGYLSKVAGIGEVLSRRHMKVVFFGRYVVMTSSRHGVFMLSVPVLVTSSVNNWAWLRHMLRTYKEKAFVAQGVVVFGYFKM